MLNGNFCAQISETAERKNHRFRSSKVSHALSSYTVKLMNLLRM